ncbi:hypothetical protein C2S51_021434 [Perilla frutescens var. frutescens]|nr:hypothetical protein C2S51_021434 [Perilla frutescens var. frutescens]
MPTHRPPQLCPTAAALPSARRRLLPSADYRLLKSGNNLILMLQILHPRLPLLRPHQQLHTVINLTFNLEVQRPLLIKFMMEEVLAKTKRNTRNIMFNGIYVIGMATILHCE